MIGIEKTIQQLHEPPEKSYQCICAYDQCEALFEPVNRKWQKFCSEPCRHAANQQAQKEKRRLKRQEDMKKLGELADQLREIK